MKEEQKKEYEKGLSYAILAILGVIVFIALIKVPQLWLVACLVLFML